MKAIKNIFALLLAVVMLASVLAAVAPAASRTWTGMALLSTAAI